MMVRDFLQLPVAKGFSVVAGRNALRNVIQTVEILDFEFAAGIQQVRDTIFNPHSLVLSSLLFANQNPGCLIDTVKKLIDLKVSALAYKPVVFKDLPDDVLAFANEQNFPILRFGGDEFFEDIILEVVNHIKKSDHALFLENMMRCLIEEEVAADQIQTFLQQLNKSFDDYAFAANIHMKQTDSDEWMSAFSRLDSFLKSGIVSTYKQSVLVIFTDRNKQLQFENILKEWMGLYAIPSDALTIGYSQAHLTQTGLHLAVKEAYYARIIAEIESRPVCHYKQLASVRLLIELYRKDGQFADNYVKTYLGALLEKESDRDLLNTAITFVIKKGNVKEVSAVHHCHPNTIRYRLAKIRQLIDPVSNDLVFYENLSSAVTLYLLLQTIEEKTVTLESVQK
ncbi:PucR family transcriptional regulator [Bacillus sp. PK3_68]|uniref:PucR family transcriptional regulator n=1 Tax=Bacillus sp. PK3_68 TaxID=2027408 RepID=UPI000E7467DC|nr:PucR family transcriptional regulator [Bacillus sp. PK3_68]RJS61362.1 PucR family transcriptional regulator [Bacillus sp. PK3_68]